MSWRGPFVLIGLALLLAGGVQAAEADIPFYLGRSGLGDIYKLEVVEQAKRQGELAPGTHCARLARLLQAQIIGLRSFAQREISSEQVAELAEDMAAMLDHYRARH